MTYDVTFVELSEQPTAVRRGHVSHLGIADFLGGAFGAVAGALGGQGLDDPATVGGHFVLREGGSGRLEPGLGERAGDRPERPAEEVGDAQVADVTTAYGGGLLTELHEGHVVGHQASWIRAKGRTSSSSKASSNSVRSSP